MNFKPKIDIYIQGAIESARILFAKSINDKEKEDELTIIINYATRQITDEFIGKIEKDVTKLLEDFKK